jgi:hypothetical protein
VKPNERTLQALQAFHDGELGWLGGQVMRWRLRSSPELRRELDELQKLGGMLRELDIQERNDPIPELWTDISAGLSRIDREEDRVRDRSERPRIKSLDFAWQPLAAMALAAALVLAVTLDFDSPIHQNPDGSPASGAEAPEVVASGALRYLKTDGRPFVVSQDRDDVTIIWLMDAPGGA